MNAATTAAASSVLLGVAAYAVLLYRTERSRWGEVALWRDRRDIAGMGAAALVGLMAWSAFGAPQGSGLADVVTYMYASSSRRHVVVTCASFAAVGAFIPIVVHLAVITIRSRLPRPSG